MKDQLIQIQENGLQSIEAAEDLKIARCNPCPVFGEKG